MSDMQQNQMTPDAEPLIRVAADLCRKTTWIGAQTRNHRVFDLFEGDLSLLNIPVLEDGKIVGLINRDSFMRRMARRFHWELYSEKRCTKMMDPSPLVVEADLPIRDLAGSLLDRNKPERISEGFVVLREGELVGTGLTSDVIAAILLLEQQASRELRRHRDLLSELVEQRTHALDEARRNQAKQNAENELAKGIIERLTSRYGDQGYPTCLQQWLQPAEHFSGDTIAACCNRAGRLYVLLADATGHGLTAAITIVPVLTLFYRMAEEAQPIEAIAAALNREVKDTMPVGRFVAASLILFDPAAGQVALWHGGMPDVLHLDAAGEVVRAYTAKQLPLGVVDTDPLLARAEYLPVSPGDCLVLYSDGLPEAENAAGQYFGHQRIRDALRQERGQDHIGSLQRALGRYLRGRLPHDDISVVVLRCAPDACMTN